MMAEVPVLRADAQGGHAGVLPNRGSLRWTAKLTHVDDLQPNCSGIAHYAAAGAEADLDSVDGFMLTA